MRSSMPIMGKKEALLSKKKTGHFALLIPVDSASQLRLRWPDK